MKRRNLLATMGAGAAASTFPAPAIAQGIREFKLVSSYGPTSPTDKLLVHTLTEASGGRFRVKFYGADELVGGFEVFDAVAEGVADMYISAEYYWQDRSPAFNFFTSVPYGLAPREMSAWIYQGGGQELWDELSANFNLKPFHAGISEVQMGGWYNKEISSVESFEGLRIRIPGLGGEVMRRLGAIPVTLPYTEILPAMRSGALDAAELVGPDQDFTFGLHTAGKYYYYPGVHEPGTIQSVAVNKKLWDSLSADERRLIKIALAGFHRFYNTGLVVRQMTALTVLLEEPGVQLRKFDDATLRAFGKASGEVIAEVGASDPFTRRVYDSYMKFRETSREWTDISERAYLNARELDFPYGA